ncbi:sensor histidine kinase [Cellulomonas fimi]|uniref:histidine kinase n=1 Tax=Cellulomonas fimi TaxID=1708 RepID=A0A7Y0QHM0_CELFI|nr:ATP-binding protein [Cellulomonas fimi]NMR20313.1 ATP-binding protein [Cellulomonas fimi]
MRDTRHDVVGDRRALLLGAGVVCALFAVGAAAQTAWVYGQVLPDGPGAPFLDRLLANAVAVVVDLVVLVALRTEVRRRAWERGSALLVAAVVAAGARVAVQLAVGVHEPAATREVLVELVSGLLAAGAANVLGLALLTSRQRLRRQVLATAASRTQIRLALDALQHEEVRVRREVAEGLHGSLQQRLVIVTARVQALADRLSDGPATPADVAELRAVARTLEQAREGDVREMSRMLYPEGLEVGMVPAVRSLLGRLPASIATRLVVADPVRRLDDPASPALSRSERLLAVRIVEEGVTNALRHGGAGSLEVTLGLERGGLRLTVRDDGVGLDPERAAEPSGTARLGDRLELVGGSLELRPGSPGGAVLTAWLPVTADAEDGVTAGVTAAGR